MFIQACMRLGMHRYIEYVQPGQGVAQGVCVCERESTLSDTTMLRWFTTSRRYCYRRPHTRA